MDCAGPLNEVVVFEPPTKLWAESLMTYLAPGRLTWVQHAEASSVVGALLKPDVDDLAALLRSVEAWLDRSGLAAMRFELDGRAYVLDSAHAATAVA